MCPEIKAIALDTILRRRAPAAAAGAHILMLGSYADWKEGSEQYRWLVADLAAFNRSRTPWLIATFHAPW